MSEPCNYSKTTLYAALQTYEQSGVPQRNRAPPSLPKSAEALSKFLHEVSRNYHHTQCRSVYPSQARNGGSNPISAKLCKDGIAQKAVTLVGGKFYKPANTKTTTNRIGKSQPHRRKPNQRRRMVVSKADAAFLRTLETQWLFYFQSNVIGSADKHNWGCPQTIAHRISQSSCSNDIEWVGARVRIHKCSSHRAWESLYGILIQNCQNVWIVAILVGEDANEPVSSSKESPNHKHNNRTLTVPKKGTVLKAIVPIPDESSSSSSSSSSTTTTDSPSKRLCLELSPE